MSEPRRGHAGFTLVELMVALGVSLIAMLAAVQLYAHAGSALRTVQAQQSLTETAALAVTAIRDGTELAGYLAFARPEQFDPRFGAAGDAGPVANDCGANWALRLNEPVGGDDNAYRWACRAYAGAPAAGADTLVVRYVDPHAAERLDSGHLYLESTASGTARIFRSTRSETVPGVALTSINAVQVRGYYVSSTSAGSSAAEPMPSLRMKYLTRSASGPRIVDEELQPGVEDLQVEFGIATDDSLNDAVEQFVTPAELHPSADVLAVRIWLLVRSNWPEHSFRGETIPSYANRAATTYRDGYRRKLVSTTIAIHDDRAL